MLSRVLSIGIVVAMTGCGRGEPTAGTGASTAGTGAPTAGSPAPPPPTPARIDWRGDLAVLARELPRRHVDPFTRVAEADWRTEVAALDAALPTLDDAQAQAGLIRIVARLGDGHTRVEPRDGASFPLRLYDFADGMRVLGAKDAGLVGATITAIGTTSIADARTALAAYIPHENAPWLRIGLAQALVSPMLLRGAGIIADTTHATYRFTLTDGTARDVALTPDTPPPITPPATLPLWLQKSRLAYWNTYEATTQLLYFAFNQCVDSTPPFAEFVGSTMAFADQHPVARFVVDLRHNGGGNSEIIEPLLAGLAARPALRGRLFAIVGRETFSSGLLDALYLHRAGAVLVGEPTGGSPSHHGEVKQFTLPSSGLTIDYSTKYFANPDVPGDTLAPDLAAPLDYAAWTAGRDPALEAILAAPRPK